MKIPANANTKQLRKIIDDLRDEATGWHQAAKKAEGALQAAQDQLAARIHADLLKANTRIDAMGDNKPWRLAALAFVAGIVIGWIGNGVL